MGKLLKSRKDVIARGLHLRCLQLVAARPRNRSLIFGIGLRFDPLPHFAPDVRVLRLHVILVGTWVVLGLLQGLPDERSEGHPLAPLPDAGGVLEVGLLEFAG